MDSALLAPWPEPIDKKVDIYIPGKVEAFKAALKQALASRQLLAVITSNVRLRFTISRWQTLAQTPPTCRRHSTV